MKKNILISAMLFAASSVSISAEELSLEVWYSPSIIESGERGQLNWNSNAERCENNSGTELSTSDSSGRIRKEVGYFTSTITCYDSSGNSISRLGELFVVHEKPSSFGNRLDDVAGGRNYTNKFPSPSSLEVAGHVDFNNGCNAVKTLSKLTQCLNPSSSKKVVFVDGDAVIYLSKSAPLVIPEGFTLASNRGVNGAPGGALFLNQASSKASFRAIRMMSNSRLTGLRVKGPHPDFVTYPSSQLVGGISIGYDIFHESVENNNEGFNVDSEFLNVSNVQIDNNNIYGWSHFGVGAGYGVKDVKINNNLIHNNQAYNYGYGVVANGTETGAGSSIKIYENVFSKNRHDIASSGYYGNSYSAEYNVVFNGPDLGSGGDLHRFDVHACFSRASCTFEEPGYLGQARATSHSNFFKFPESVGLSALEQQGVDAGSFFSIANNIFSLTDTKQKAIRFVGEPLSESPITGNFFSHYTEMATGAGQSDKAIELRKFSTDSFPYAVLGKQEGNFYIWGNHTRCESNC